MPLPRTRSWRPLWLPSGIRALRLLSGRRTGTTAPSAASQGVTGGLRCRSRRRRESARAAWWISSNGSPAIAAHAGASLAGQADELVRARPRNPHVQGARLTTPLRIQPEPRSDLAGGAVEGVLEIEHDLAW